MIVGGSRWWGCSDVVGCARVVVVIEEVRDSEDDDVDEDADDADDVEVEEDVEDEDSDDVEDAEDPVVEVDVVDVVLCGDVARSIDVGLVVDGGCWLSLDVVVVVTGVEVLLFDGSMMDGGRAVAYETRDPVGVTRLYVILIQLLVIHIRSNRI